MTTSSTKKSKTNVRRVRDGVSAYRPRLQDFKIRGSEGKSSRIGSDRERAIESQRSLQTRRMHDIFDSFRTDIEDMMMPWSSSSSLWDPGPLPYQGNALDFKDSSTVNTLSAPNLGQASPVFCLDHSFWTNYKEYLSKNYNRHTAKCRLISVLR